MSANLIMRREWIKGIVWAGRGGTFHTAACHLILSPNSGLICWSSMPANNFCLSDRQWSCHLVVHHGLLYCAFCPAPTKSPDKGLNWMANLCVFHVRTCINTSFKSSRNACRLVFACILPSVSTRKCRETTVHTKLGAHTPYRNLFWGYLFIYSDVRNYCFQSLWLNCKQIQWTRFN